MNDATRAWPHQHPHHKLDLRPVLPLLGKVAGDALRLADGATPEEVGALLIDAVALVEAIRALTRTTPPAV